MAAAAVSSMESESVIDTSRTMRTRIETWDLAFVAEQWSCGDIKKDDKVDNGGKIILPRSQRLYGWNSKQEETLIDSIMQGWPIPSPVLHENSEKRLEVYDGRHRFQTTWRYVNNKFTWKGKYYKDLSPFEKHTFDNRQITVNIVYNRGAEATIRPELLAEMFTRLNSGKKVTDYDQLWAMSESNVMKLVKSLIQERTDLKEVFGNINMTERRDLSNWTAHAYGLGTKNSDNFTTSYIRITDEIGLDSDVLDEDMIRSGIDALCAMYKLAYDQMSSTTNAERRTYKKIGKINAFFLTEWMESSEKTAIISKWATIVNLLRGSEGKDKAEDIKNALTTRGAQNLNKKKIKTILEQVNRYIQRGEVTDVGEISEDDSE